MVPKSTREMEAKAASSNDLLNVWTARSKVLLRMRYRVLLHHMPNCGAHRTGLPGDSKILR